MRRLRSTHRDEDIPRQAFIMNLDAKVSYARYSEKFSLSRIDEFTIMNSHSDESSAVIRHSYGIHLDTILQTHDSGLDFLAQSLIYAILIEA